MDFEPSKKQFLTGSIYLEVEKLKKFSGFTITTHVILLSNNTYILRLAI